VLTADEFDGVDLAAHDITPESLLLQLENSQSVLNALAGLPVPYREMILLSDMEGLSYREIAQVLADPIGTVMSRLSRGRKMLRQALLADSPGGPLMQCNSTAAVLGTHLDGELPLHQAAAVQAHLGTCLHIATRFPSQIDREWPLARGRLVNHDAFISGLDSLCAQYEQIAWKTAGSNSILLFEDLHHKLRLNLIQLLQRRLDIRLVFIRSFVEDVLKTKGRTLDERFGIFEFSAVIPSVQMNLVCIPSYQLKGLRSLHGIARIELLTSKFRHLTHELCIKKAFVPKLRSICLDLECGESV
jgi:hypothetical protein